MGDERMAQHNVVQWYAELKGYQPKIWRRFEINGEKTMAELAYAIMIMFEMQASHLFTIKESVQTSVWKELPKHFPEEDVQKFREKYQDTPLFQDIQYGIAYEDMELVAKERFVEADTVRLNQVINSKSTGTNFHFIYDFGDQWEIILVMEAVEKKEMSLAKLPRVLEGEGFGIIEDVGGVRELRELAATLKKGSGTAYEAYTRWMDSITVDLESFDREDVNFRLKKLAGMYKNSYEYEEYPTENQLKWLLRGYLGKGSRGY